MIVAEHSDSVQPEWLDANGHMNLAYYVVVFDRGTDAWLDLAGMGEAYRALGNTVFAVETHTLYRRELRRDEAMTVRSWLIGADAKRIHLAHEMIAGDETVAMQEVLFVHVSLDTRRVKPLASVLAGRMAALTGEAPDWAGRRIGLPGTAKTLA